MSGAPPVVAATYAGAEALLDSRLFAHLLGALQAQLPLRNLHWKPSPASSFYTGAAAPAAGSSSSLPGSAGANASAIRTIQQLPLRLQPLADELLRARLKPETRHLVLKSLLERPFVHLYFVVCDDNEAYRTSIRNDIRAWIASVQSLPSLLGGSGPASAVPAHARESSSRPGTPRSSSGPAAAAESPGGAAAQPDDERAAAAGPEYLIVLLSPQDQGTAAALGVPPAAASRGLSPSPADEKAKTGLGRVFGGAAAKGSVIDKMKADFNSGKRERIVHLTRMPSLPAGGTPAGAAHSADPTLFADLLMRLKECAGATFDGLVALQEEETRREWRNKELPGWSLCKWVTGMECLANTFEGVGLYKEALSKYDEIDGAFQQCMNEHNLTFFPSTGGTTPGDDSALLLDVRKKPYAELIMRNEITLFDFRCYVFARRAALLGKLGRVAQVMYETPPFLDGVGAMLRGGDTLPAHFIESWIFSSSLDVVEQCQAWLIERGDIAAPGMTDADGSVDRSIEGQLSAAFHAAKADLLELARAQLDLIGMATGHLPSTLPFSRSRPVTERDLPAVPPGEEQRDLPALPEEAKQSAGKITRQELQQAVDSCEIFDLHFVALTERVIACSESAGRRESVLQLRAVLASLNFYRKRYETALLTLGKLAEMHAAERVPLDAHLLAKQLACHEKLGKTRDRAWVHNAVALVKRLADGRRPGSSPSTHAVPASADDPSVRWGSEETLYSELRSVPCDKEMPISQFTPLSLRPAAKWALQAQDQDGSTLAGRVHFSGVAPLEVDDVRMCLISGERDQLWFTSGRTTLKPGLNDVRLACASPAPGKYILDVSQIRLSRIIFQYASPRAVPGAIVIGVPEDGDAFDARIQMPQTVRIDDQRHADLLIETGRNDVLRAEIRVALSGPSRASGAGARILAGLAEAQQTAGSAKLEVAEDGSLLTLRDLPARSSHTLRFPLYELSAATGGVLQLALTVSYWSKQPRPKARRIFQRQVDLNVALPLGVNVQDYFRAERLFSRFSISAGSSSTLRMGPVELVHADESRKPAFEISSPSSRPRIVISARQPASYVFCIKRSAGVAAASPPSETKLRLLLRYRPLHEEAQKLVSRLLAAAVADGSVPHSLSAGRLLCIERALLRLVDIALDVQTFASTGALRVGLYEEGIWRRACDRWGLEPGSADADAAVALVQEVLRRAAACTPFAADELEQWNTLSIPVDIPQVDIVNSVSLKLHDGGQPLIVGQPVAATLSVETSFVWAAPAPPRASSKPPASAADDDDFEDARSDVVSDAGEDAQAQALRMMYDVQVDYESWVASGAKKDSFALSMPAASAGREARAPPAKATFSLTLVPLRAGSLLLPPVNVWALPAGQEGEEPSGAAANGDGPAAPSCATHLAEACARVEVIATRAPPPSHQWAEELRRRSLELQAR